jgi:hypothetical protein
VTLLLVVVVRSGGGVRHGQRRRRRGHVRLREKVSPDRIQAPANARVGNVARATTTPAMLFHVDMVTSALCRRQHAYARAPRAVAQAEMANFGNCLGLKSLGALDLE